MSLKHPPVGFSFVPAYDVSALPWVTGSVVTSGSIAQRIDFPKVTKYIKVSPTTTDLRVGFTENGLLSTSHYFTVAAGTVVEFDVRVREMFVVTPGNAGTVDIFAGLTTIDANQMSYLTSSTTYTGSIMGAGWPGVG